MLIGFTSHGDRGSGLSTTVVCLALALSYHFGYQVLVCDFQEIGNETPTGALNSYRRILTGEMLSSETDNWNYDYLLRMASHGMLSKDNFKNFTTSIGLSGILDLTTWGESAFIPSFMEPDTHELIERSYKLVMQLAKSVYDFVIVDFGALSEDKTRIFSELQPTKWIVHARQDVQGCDINKITAKQRYDDEHIGFTVGRAVKGTRGGISQIKSQYKSRWLGCLSTTHEVPNSISDGGLERYFRRSVNGKGKSQNEGIVKESIEIANALISSTNCSIRR